MDSQSPLHVEPVQPITPPVAAPPTVPSTPSPTSPPPTPFLPAAPKPNPLVPASPPIAPKTPHSEPPKPAQPPRSPWILIILALSFVLIASFVGILIWQRVAPQSAPVLPGFIPGQVDDLPSRPSDPDDEDSGLAEDSPEMCTLDAMECPDGTMVGRSGPDCAFICPDGQSYGGSGGEEYLQESLDDTSEGFTLADDAREDVEFDNTYHNPTYYITYKFPTVLDVRDTKPYPRDDILFRHGFFDTDINIDDGYVEASTLPLFELIEKTKQEHPEATVTELTNVIYNGETWAHYAFVNGIITHEHIFIERGDQTFHMWSSGLSYRIAHFAEDIRFTQ